MNRLIASGVIASALCLCSSALALDARSGSEMQGQMARLNVPFIANEGQLSDESVRFYARTLGGVVFVTATGEIVYALPKFEPGSAGNAFAPGGGMTGVWALRERLENARSIRPAGGHASVTKASFFQGDPGKWRSGVATFDSVSLSEVYDGITVSLTAYGNNVEKIFTVAPGADPETIRLALEGSLGLSVDGRGELSVETGLGPVRFTAPKAWQERGGQRQDVAVAYRLEGEVYGFDVGAYDAELPLFIDPLLASTLLGGNGTEAANALAVDAAHNVYVAGRTMWSDFPVTPGAVGTNCNGGYDVFVSKFDFNLTNLLASTFLGGNTNDVCTSLALDAQTNVYVVGYTRSTNFPVTAGAYDTTYNGPTAEFGYGSAFVAKLGGRLTNLLAATYLGGTNDDYANAVCVDGLGYVYVAGVTTSTNFPVTAGAYQADSGASFVENGFITRFTGNLTNIAASTFLGGDGADVIRDLKLATDGDVLVAGNTTSVDFPVSADAYSRTFKGGFTDGDAFVSRLDFGLSNLLASTYLGGGDDDMGISLALDSHGRVYLSGSIYSTDFPVTHGAYSTNSAGNIDCFISRFNETLTNLEASTYLGGGGDDLLQAMAVADAVYVTGTFSADFPFSAGSYRGGFPSVFIARLDAQLGFLQSCGSIGSGAVGGDKATGLVLDTSTNVIIAGWSCSDASGDRNFPTTHDAYTRFHNPSTTPSACAFVSKFDSWLLAFSGPTGFVASVGTYADKVAPSWSNNVFATSYAVFRNNSNDSWSAALVGTTNTLSYDDTSAIAGSNYFYWVAGRFRSETGSVSDAAYGYRTFSGAPDAPTGVIASSGTYSNGVLVAWNEVAGATGYEIWRNTADDFVSATLVARPLGQPCMETSAVAGVEYYYWVKATNASGFSAFTSPSAYGLRRAAALLDALNLPQYIPLVMTGPVGSFWFAQTPTNHDGISAAQSGAILDNETSVMEIRVSGPGQVGFWWQVSSEVDCDYLEFYMDDVLTTDITGDIPWKQETISISSGNHTLRWDYVKDSAASNGADAGWVDEVQLLIPPQSAPANLAAGRGADTDRVALQWDAVPTASGYTIWRNTSNHQASAVMLDSTASTNYPDMSASPGFMYYYWVRGTNSQGAGPAASDIGWRIMPPPASVSASEGTYTDRVAVAWSLVTNATGYTVWRCASNQSASALQIGSATGVSYADMNVSEGLTNYYWVIATNDLGESGFGTPGIGWRAFWLGPPAGVLASDGIYRDRVQVVWNSVANASGYSVWRGLGDSPIWAQELAGTTGLAYSDTGAERGVRYFYWVRATNTAGASAFSDSDVGWRYRYVSGDYDGDGSSELVVYDTENGLWYIRSVAGTVVAWAVSWGGVGLEPVQGDYDGDGVMDLAVYGEATGSWYIRTLSGTVILWGDAFGGAGLIPVSGDFDGDNVFDLAVYAEATGLWYIRTVSGASVAWALSWGGTGMSHVSGNFGGQSGTDLALFAEASGTWYAQTLDGSHILWAEEWGASGFEPVPGDYDGDGVDDMTVYDQASGLWYARTVGGSILFWAQSWGGSGLMPVSGDYDGDGVYDLALYESSTGLWFIRTAAGGLILWAESWGGPGLVPVGP